MVAREKAKQWVEENHGDGWLPLVDKVYDRLPEHIRIMEVSERWGQLIFKADPCDADFEDFLWDIQHESGHICELCGNPGYSMVVENWERALCNPCFQTFKDPKFKSDAFWLENSVYYGSNGRASLIDFKMPVNFNGKLILFLHGYMGFKDWGAWNLVESYFTEKGFAFCKFNFSHNGGTVENGIDFPDLQAFAANSYSKEVNDVQQVLDWMLHLLDDYPEIHLLGHSRGGGIALLSAQDPRIKSVTTLAGICSVEQRFSGEQMMADWKATGIRYVTNQRTQQQMPHNYSQAEDFLANKDKLDIEKACRNLDRPVLVIHGDKDTSVSIEEGQKIAGWTGTALQVIPGADHVFGSSQPWKSDELPELLKMVCEKVEEFVLKV